jgi:hypothetical protein
MAGGVRTLLQVSNELLMFPVHVDVPLLRKVDSGHCARLPYDRFFLDVEANSDIT